MKSLGNIGGALYFLDIPVIRFKCIKGVIVSMEMLTTDLSKLPVEFLDKSSYEALEEFLVDQVTPDTRHGIHELLEVSSIQYYDVERMLRYSHGFNIDSLHWLKQDDDISCWEGTPLEGKGIEPIESFYDLPLIKKLPKTSVLLK